MVTLRIVARQGMPGYITDRHETPGSEGRKKTIGEYGAFSLKLHSVLPLQHKTLEKEQKLQKNRPKAVFSIARVVAAEE